MNQKFLFAIFIGIFLAIYASMNYYVLSRLAGLLSYDENLLLWIPLAVLSSSFILATFIAFKSGNIFSTAFYALSASWMGVVFIALMLTALHDFLGLFISIPVFYGTIIIPLSLAIFLAGHINSRIIRTRQVDIESAKLTRPLQIVHLSDLHIGPINRRSFLKKIVARTNRLKPDLVLLTGDLVDGSISHSKKDFFILRGIKAPVFFVTGNHEGFSGIKYSLEIARLSGLKILRGSSVNFKELEIIGIDDNDSHKKAAFCLDNIRINKRAFSILMYHRPRIFEIVQGKVDLVLSGHTHNGQIWPFAFFAYLENSYVYGVYKAKGSKLNVSSGVGTWGPPARIGSSSEIVLIRLKPG